MPQNKRVKRNQRQSLIVRMQPTKGTPLAEVVDWLHDMPSKSRKEKIDEACLMFLLPMARAELKQDQNETESCYWDTHNRILHYLYVMRQTLGIRAIQPMAPIIPFTTGNVQVNNDDSEIEVEEELEERTEGLGVDFSLMFGTSM